MVRTHIHPQEGGREQRKASGGGDDKSALQPQLGKSHRKVTGL